MSGVDEYSEPAATLTELRARIDQLDTALVKLLNERAACALAIGAIKQAQGMPVYQPSREHDVVTHVTSVNPGPLEGPAVARVFERIIDESRRLERPREKVRRSGSDEGE